MSEDEPTVRELIEDQLIDLIQITEVTLEGSGITIHALTPHVTVRLDKQDVGDVPSEIWSHVNLLPDREDDTEFCAKLVKLEWRDHYLVDLTYWIYE